MVLLVGCVGLALAACSGGDKSSSDSKSSDSKSKDKSSSKSAPANPGKGEKKQQAEQKPDTVSKNKVVADVNGHKITGTTYNRALTQVHQQAQQQQAQQGQQPGGDAQSKKLQKQEKKQAVDSVVGNELLLQDANKRGFDAPKDKVTKQVNKAKKQYKTKKQLQKALKQNHLTMHKLRSQMADQVKLDSYVKKELGPFKVSSQQIKKAYKQSQQQQKQQQKQQGKKSKKGSGGQSLKKMKPQIKKQLQDQKKQKKVSSQVSKLKKKGDVKVKI